MFANKGLKLYDACNEGDINKVQDLIHRGADVNYKDKDGNTPLMIASFVGRLDVVQLLLDSGADVDMKNNDGKTALYWATLLDRLNVVLILQDRGANIHGKDDDDEGKTATLHNKPRFFDRNDVVRRSHDDRGADKHGTDNDEGKTAQYWAKLVDRLEHLLQDRGADNHGKDIDDGKTVPHNKARLFDRLERLLHDRGADNHGKDNDEGKTAQYWARLVDRLDVVRMMQDRGGDSTEKKRDRLKPEERAKNSNNVTDVSSSREDDEQFTFKVPSTIEREIQILRTRVHFIKAMQNPQNADILTDIPFAYIEYCTEQFTSKKLGKGGFGQVYFAQDAEESTIQYAVKKVSGDKIQSSRKEMEALRRLNHPNIVRLYGTSSHNDDTYLLLQYISHGSMSTFLHTEDGRRQLDALTRVNVLCGIAQAMHFLHSGGAVDEEKQKYNFCHRDIKSDNICLNDRFYPVLIDYGVAKITAAYNHPEPHSVAQTLMQTNAHSVRLGTILYMCPEYERGEIEYGPKCDVYSFGVVMMELLTGTLQGSVQVSTAQGNKDRPVDLARRYRRNSTMLCDMFDQVAGSGWDHVKAKLSDLAIQCIEYDYDERPTSFDIKNKLTCIQRDMGKVFHFSSFNVDDIDNPPALSCQICNIPCRESHSIECRNGHVVDSQCFCNRNRSLGACPICNVEVDIMSLTSKIPPEFLLSMLWMNQRDMLENHNILANKMDQVNSRLEYLWNDMTMIATKEYPCPRYVFMTSTATNQRGKKWRDWLSEPVPITVYFVCEKSHALVKAFETDMARDWIKKVAPAMSLSLKILTKVGFNLVDPSGSIASAATTFSQFIFDQALKSFDQKLSDFAYARKSDLLSTDKMVNDNDFKGSEVVEVLEGSYQALVQEANKHPDWKTRMICEISVTTGKLVWFKKEAT